jgi:hypothetical protein
MKCVISTYDGIDHNRSLRSHLKQKSQARNLSYRPETLTLRVLRPRWSTGAKMMHMSAK